MLGFLRTYMRLRHISLTVSALVLIVAAAIASPAVFSVLRAVPQSEDIVVQWRLSNETGVQFFDVERSSDEVPEFRRLERISARGTGSVYSYTDNGAFYKPNAGKTFRYRIRVSGSGGDYYSSHVTVVHEVSSVKRSWGMIKELFR